MWGLEKVAKNKIKPFLRWPGGKRWLVDMIKDSINLSPNGKYIEPFLGSGALFFALTPSVAELSDTNEELIELFVIMRDKPNELRERMLYLQKHHSHENYYMVRSSCPKTAVNRAARTLYLNRTCFNGMYRVNKEGKFNVPIGTKYNCTYDLQLFSEYSKILRNAQIYKADFERVIANADAGDFVFADPPYAVSGKEVFTKYNDQLFVWNDQLRLFNSLIEAKNRGVNIISTNAYCEELVNMYSQSGFYVKRVNRHCSIAGNPDKRKQVTELLISTEFIGE